MVKLGDCIQQTPSCCSGKGSRNVAKQSRTRGHSLKHFCALFLCSSLSLFIKGTILLSTYSLSQNSALNSYSCTYSHLGPAQYNHSLLPMATEKLWLTSLLLCLECWWQGGMEINLSLYGMVWSTFMQRPCSNKSMLSPHGCITLRKPIDS